MTGANIPIDNSRIFRVNDIEQETGPVVYWMSRDQRVADNWSLLYALESAAESKQSLAVIFNLVPEYLGAALRQYDFMLTGLEQVQSSLGKLNIPFFLLTGRPEMTIPAFIEKNQVQLLVTDFSPLKINRNWINKVAKKIKIPFHEVDSHNIVPCRFVSQIQEFAAYTIRPKINRSLERFLIEYPKPKKQKTPWPSPAPEINWPKLYKKLKINNSVKPVSHIKPGEKAALKTLRKFIEKKLPGYNEHRNDPTDDYQSNLSPYLHFGHISAQRIALEIQKYNGDIQSQESFLEELIVRRELSDNFCFYNGGYDSFNGFPDWAKKTLNDHRTDPRQYIYSADQFESAETHDELWNAAQMEMVKTGKMHGYMRMYWAKKILEWSPTPEKALTNAIYLNDKYQLDGRDPNGYTGIAWSIGGVHDRAWFERDIFGKIRYMSYNGCKRKFDIQKYIDTITALSTG